MSINKRKEKIHGKEFSGKKKKISKFALLKIIFK